MRPPTLVTPDARALAVLAVLLIVIGVASVQIIRANAQPSPAAQAILKGMNTAQTVNTDRNDDGFGRDDYALGAIWARRSRPN